MHQALTRLGITALVGVLSPFCAAAQCFSDADLAILKAKQASTVLYVWSPRMVLSSTEAGDVAAAAKALGLDFIPMHDPRVSESELTATLKSLPQAVLRDSRRLCSPRLIELEGTRHFPSSFVIQAGQLNTLPLVGAIPSAQYSSALASKIRNQCITQNEFIPLPPDQAGTQTDAYGNITVALGAYERISPDGRYILRSYSGARIGDVSLVELSQATPVKPSSVVRVIPTALTNEAFPVQGSWRYLVSISGEHFALKDILQHGRAAKPLFKGGMTGFYAAAAELPSHQPNHVRIRSFSWPNSSGDAKTQGEGGLAVRTITVNTKTNTISADTGHHNICANRKSEDGVLYALPMISVDGQEFAALPQAPDKLSKDGKQTMRIYGFGASGTGCEAKTSFDFASGKTIFGFPDQLQPSGSANLAYEYKGQVWWFNRALNQTFNIAPFEDINSAIRKVDASAFPGITQDGRVIYAATWERCEGAFSKVCKAEGGYVVSDPYQSNAYLQHVIQHKLMAPKACIAHAANNSAQ